uniref:Uncharacterized protein n=1 Tax=Pseudomonas marincola TaxID=437900 RepID=A0A653E6U8_9PSED
MYRARQPADGGTVAVAQTRFDRAAQKPARRSLSPAAAPCGCIPLPDIAHANAHIACVPGGTTAYRAAATIIQMLGQCTLEEQGSAHP